METWLISPVIPRPPLQTNTITRLLPLRSSTGGWSHHWALVTRLYGSVVTTKYILHWTTDLESVYQDGTGNRVHKWRLTIGDGGSLRRSSGYHSLGRTIQYEIGNWSTMNLPYTFICPRIPTNGPSRREDGFGGESPLYRFRIDVITLQCKFF